VRGWRLDLFTWQMGLILSRVRDATIEMPAPVETPSPAEPVEATVFALSGIDGAGFQNTIAAHPTNGVVLSGGDNGGMHRSTDQGRTFGPANSGMWERAHHQTAGLVWCDEYPDVVFAGVGASGTSGGFAWSNDQGLTWQIRDGQQPMFAANSGSAWASGTVPAAQPRSTGRLAAWWTDTDDTGYVWVASAQDGVWRADFDPLAANAADIVSNWTRTGGTGIDDGKCLRALSVNSTGTTVLVAVFGDVNESDPDRWDAHGRVWRIDSANNATAPTTATQETNAPRTPEDILWLEDKTYVAASGASPGPATDQGVWRRTATNTWSQIDDNAANDVEFKSLTGAVSSGTHILWAGANDSDETNPDAYCVRRTDDAEAGTPTWVSLSDFADNERQYTLGDADGPVWWAGDDLGWTYWNRDFAASDLHYVADDDVLYAAGRSGSYRHDDPQLSTPTGEVLWPINRGLNVTFNKKTVCHPATAGTAATVNTDWAVVTTTARFATAVMARPASWDASSLSGFDMWYDSGGDLWYVCIGDRDDYDDHGQLFTSSDPWSVAWTEDTSWTTDVAGTQRPVGIAGCWEAGTESTRHLVCAAAGDGLYQKIGTGTWTKRTAADSGPTFTSASESHVIIAPIAWPAQTGTDQTFYVLDRWNNKIYRSTDSGDTLEVLTSGLGITSPEQYGWIECPAADPTILYVQTNTGVWRLDAADTVTAPVTFTAGFTDITPPRPNSESINGIAVDPNDAQRIWVGMHATDAGNLAKLMLTTDGGSTWANHADDVWRSKVQDLVVHLACDQGGDVYAALRGNGMIVGEQTWV